MAQSKTKKIAIACQGGGSHTAFTAGVLSIVLSPEYADRFDLIGFSGTSEGAVCATLAWSGLISDAPDPRAEADPLQGASHAPGCPHIAAQDLSAALGWRGSKHQ